MKIPLIGTALFVVTAATVAFYPALANRSSMPPSTRPMVEHPLAQQRPVIDVVFVLDTTGSMTGLIDAAKEKIWSIASSMASAQPTPVIRIGLVGYRDRGDAYVTRVVDLSSDIDTTYATLMQFTAAGGGDTPESVNEALYDAVHRMSWSADANAYKVIFLVGDAPPHMDYPDDVKYPQTIATAAENGIVVNAIQCGADQQTRVQWQQIASAGHGSYFDVDQAGSAVALATPYDAELAKLSAQLDATRLYYGTPEEKAKLHAKVAATDTLHALASAASQARRAAFNATAAGEANAIGEGDLVSDVAAGRVDLATVAPAALPAPLQALSLDARKALVEKNASERADLKKQIETLSKQRDEYAAEQIAARGGAKDSLDEKIYGAVREQAAKKGLAYPDAPKY
jgi:Mg-chelatase subunit ChlD